MKIFAKLSIVSCLLLAAAPVSAQSYSDVLLNQMKNRYSASNFSSSAMQNSLTRRSTPNYAGFNSPSKPFSSYQRSSGMSPYMGLLGANPYQSTVDNYQKIVRPQLEAQRQQERQTQSQIASGQKLGSIASQAPYSLQGAADRAPTGHASVYFNYGGYYTPVQPHGVRGRR